MNRSLPVIALLLLVAMGLAASYSVRYGLMEDGQWVGLCAVPTEHWQCQVRATLGLWIHFQWIGWSALTLAVISQFVSGRVGKWLAVLALLAGLPALVLYTASLAVFAVVLAGLRLVRSHGAAHLPG
ncbi:hypothetical protein IAE35_07385 [Pseudomonas sp. S75]|uniref:hypothetical protein n=1 Tax=unclassified Pseudomonas TaxID=196821 RepID=UPI0019087D43|nr:MULTISPECIES: hypothetical protein [unclassified Pseudomonas]MBJ9975608.1 hypothetical protein [Pseudomonas sp. S30]MBK0153159.1 hypothetical protein [Pseudomonas sp. S75]